MIMRANMFKCFDSTLKLLKLSHFVVLLLLPCLVVFDAAASTIEVAASRSRLITFPQDMAEVIIADPGIADVYSHGTRKLSIIGKCQGQTSLRVFGKDGGMLGEYAVVVGMDLPAIRKALKQFLPNENIAAEVVSTNIALTGQVSSASVVSKALQITREFLKSGEDRSGECIDLTVALVESKRIDEDPNSGILNLLQVTSGQQVMLKVRVGEVNRTALKQLGIEWANLGRFNDFYLTNAKDTGQQLFQVGSEAAFLANPEETLTTFGLGWASGASQINLKLNALEQDGLFKLLAEPNLVAVSGQEAEFLAGGELPIPVPQPGGGGGNTQLTIEFKPFGVAVKFKPFVLSENRLRMEVAPEVSELDSSLSVNLAGFNVPGISTRRAKTTVELAPGESFMIAGLIKDEGRTNINSLPGVKELPVLGALFRSTEFQRNETELVIAVTPYLVDPVASKDIKLPTDGYAPASDMEMVFYGALTSRSRGPLQRTQTPELEGPVGFMVD